VVALWVCLVHGIACFTNICKLLARDSFVVQIFGTNYEIGVRRVELSHK
jgi:hypothetical protein